MKKNSEHKRGVKSYRKRALRNRNKMVSKHTYYKLNPKSPLISKKPRKSKDSVKRSKNYYKFRGVHKTGKKN